MLTQDRLKEVIFYNPSTGVFTWNVDVGYKIKTGDVAGTINPRGYRRIIINGKNYAAHRLAWLYAYGYCPEHVIDHMNGNRADNRLDNIRHVTRSCNSQNRKCSDGTVSGFNGVCFDKRTKRWKSYITVNRNRIHIGRYDSEIDAAIARVQYENECPDWVCDHRAVNRRKLINMGHGV